MLKRRSLLQVNEKILPTGYERLRYILTNKQQYFDTGVYGTLDTRLKMYCGIDTNNTNAIYMFGCRSNTGGQTTRNGYCIAFDYNQGTPNKRLWYGIDSKASGITTYAQYSTKQILKVEIKNTSLYVNNILSRTTSNTSEFTTGMTLLYGAMYDYNNNTFTPITDLQGDNIQILGELELETLTDNYHFYPCKRLSDGVVGFYDIINNTFIVNQGSGTVGYITWFGARVNPQSGILPSGYTQKQYVQGNGAEYIRLPNFDFSNDLEIDFTEYNHATNSRWLFGWYDSPQYPAYQYNTGTGTIYTGQDSSSATFIPTENTRYNLKITQSNVLIDNTVINPRKLPLSTTVNNLTIFGRTNTVNYGYYKIYSLIVKDSQGNELYNFVPCVRDSDSEVGFYDIVNNVFRGNESGSGAFTTN